MKRLTVVLSVLAFIFTLSSFAQAEIKIGVVDLFKVLNESEEGKRSIGELQKMVDSRQKSLEEKQKKIQSLREEYEKKKSVLNEEARKSKEEEIERLGRELQRTVADYQVELQKKQNEITQSMLKEIRQIINEFAQKEGYSLILERAEQLLIFVTPTIDITDRIIALFNQKTEAQKGKK